MAHSLSNDFDRRREFDFDVDVTSRTLTHDVASDAVVGAAMVFPDDWNLKDVPLEDGRVEGQDSIVLSTPVDI